MAITITPLHPLFAAEVSGVDASQPLSAADRDAVESAFLKYAVVVLRDQTLTDNQQVAFARQFGVPEPGIAAKLGGAARIKQAEIVDISNLQASGEVRPKDNRSRLIGLGNQLWHQDSAYREAPAAYSMLYAHVVPDADGDTEYCDMRAAYDDLPEDIRTMIEPLSAAHDYAYSRAILGFIDFTEQEIKALPPVVQPLVLTHPQTGRKSLFVGCYASHIMGWPIPEGRLLILDLMMRAAQRKFVYAHRWLAGDLVIWDNRCTMHRGRPFDETQVRDLRRVTTEDESRRAALAA